MLDHLLLKPRTNLYIKNEKTLEALLLTSLCELCKLTSVCDPRESTGELSI